MNRSLFITCTTWTVRILVLLTIGFGLTTAVTYFTKQQRLWYGIAFLGTFAALALVVLLRAIVLGELSIVAKQMRQRSLGTALTLLSVLLGTALATGIIILRRGGESLFVQKDYGYDVIVGSSKGSPLQLVLNTAYHIDRSPGVLPYWVYEQLSDRTRSVGGRFDYRGHVRMAIPFARGDTFKSRPIIATTPQMFGFDDKQEPIPLFKEENGKATDQLSDSIFQYRPGERFELAEGRVFHPQKFEAVIGAEVARNLRLGLGKRFHATHGESKDTGPVAEDDHGHGDHPPGEHAHDEEWTVVGVLKPTGTANDRCIYIPLISFYCIPQHEEGLKGQSAAQMGMSSLNEGPATQKSAPYKINPDGTIDLAISPGKWQISGVLIKSRGGIMAQRLIYHINNGGVSDAVAVNPAETMRTFFTTFLQPSSQILFMISVLVSILAGVSILVSIYNSISARNKEIAILRALGATKGKVLLLICLEAGLIGLAGALLGWMAGHLIGAAASNVMEKQVGQGFNWMAVSQDELLYIGLVMVIAILAGLVPALKAYRTPVATNLVAQ